MPRLLLVSGKGGVGKSTVAAALALLLHGRGRRVLLARLGRHPGPPPPIDVSSSSVDGEAALAEYLGIVLGERLARQVTRASLYRRFVAAAPGLRELMALGKIADEARGGAWDTVIVDTPATGHILQGLRMPAAAAGLFGGLVLREVERLLRELRDPVLTRVVPVTLPEEMAVSETHELVAALAAMGLASGTIVVNRVHRAPLAPEHVPLPPAGATPLAVAVLRCARAEAVRAATARRHLARLGPGVATLPFVPRAELGRDELELLAAELGRQEVA